MGTKLKAGDRTANQLVGITSKTGMQTLVRAAKEAPKPTKALRMLMATPTPATKQYR